MKNFLLGKGKFKRFQDKIFLKDVDGTNITYKQFIESIDIKINLLKKKKIKEKDTIILLTNNSISSALIIFAAAKYGLKLITLPQHSTNLEIINSDNEFKPKLIVSFEKRNKIRGLKKNISYFDNKISKKKTFVKIKTVSKNGLLIVKSSGTTGPSKNICLGFDNLWKSGENFCKIHKVSENSYFWNYLPFSYLGGLFNLLILPATSGSTILIDKSFNSTMLLSFVSTIQNNKITHLWLVPSILKSLLILHKHSNLNLKDIGLKKIFVGTAPLEYNLKKEFEKKFGIYPLENYGLSETTFLTTELSNDKNSLTKGYLGKKVKGIKMRLKKEKKSNFGEIEVKTPFLFKGYYVGRKFIRVSNSSFFPTGDIGQIKNNLVKIVGRKKNIIKKGGVMLLPSEIENNLKLFDNSIEAVCLKKDSYLYGEDFDLFVKINKKKVNIENINKKFKDWYYKSFSDLFWPDTFYSIKKYPLTSTGKIEVYKLNNNKYKKNAF